MKFLLVLAILCAPAHATVDARYNAHDTIVKAQIGTNRPTSGPKYNALIRKGKGTPATFERMVCRENPALPGSIVCTQKRTTHGY